MFVKEKVIFVLHHSYTQRTKYVTFSQEPHVGLHLFSSRLWSWIG